MGRTGARRAMAVSPYPSVPMPRPLSVSSPIAGLDAPVLSSVFVFLQKVANAGPLSAVCQHWCLCYRRKEAWSGIVIDLRGWDPERVPMICHDQLFQHPWAHARGIAVDTRHLSAFTSLGRALGVPVYGCWAWRRPLLPWSVRWAPLPTIHSSIWNWPDGSIRGMCVAISSAPVQPCHAAVAFRIADVDLAVHAGISVGLATITDARRLIQAHCPSADLEMQRGERVILAHFDEEDERWTPRQPQWTVDGIPACSDPAFPLSALTPTAQLCVRLAPDRLTLSLTRTAGEEGLTLNVAPLLRRSVAPRTLIPPSTPLYCVVVCESYCRLRAPISCHPCATVAWSQGVPASISVGGEPMEVLAVATAP